jgi:hypothetical protein
MAFGVPCHDDAEWTCNLCERAICGECEPSPGEDEICAECWVPDVIA